MDKIGLRMDLVRKHELEGQAVEFLTQSMATDLPSTFTEKNVMKMVSILGTI